MKTIFRAEDLHKCTGVQAAVLAEESSIQYEKWQKTIHRHSEINEERKIIWEKKEKKEFNKLRNFSYRTKNIEKIKSGDIDFENDIHIDIDVIGSNETKDGVNDDDNNNNNNNNKNNNNNNDNNDDNDNNYDNNSNYLNNINNQIKKLKISSNNTINNDISGGINIDNMIDIESKWGPMIASLDPDRDVILFPSDDAFCASKFSWTEKFIEKKDDVEKEIKGIEIREIEKREVEKCQVEKKEIVRRENIEIKENLIVNNEIDNNNNNDSNTNNNSSSSSSSCGSNSHRWRLVVLEASWQHGKTMHRQLTAYRHLKGLRPLRSVIINGVTGQYWRFHEEGTNVRMYLYTYIRVRTYVWMYVRK